MDFVEEKLYRSLAYLHICYLFCMWPALPAVQLSCMVNNLTQETNFSHTSTQCKVARLMIERMLNIMELYTIHWFGGDIGDICDAGYSFYLWNSNLLTYRSMICLVRN